MRALVGAIVLTPVATGRTSELFDTNVKNYVFSRKPPKRGAVGVEFISERIKPFACSQDVLRMASFACDTRSSGKPDRALSTDGEESVDYGA